MKYVYDGVEYDHPPNPFERIEGLKRDRDEWRKVAIQLMREKNNARGGKKRVRHD